MMGGINLSFASKSGAADISVGSSCKELAIQALGRIWSLRTYDVQCLYPIHQWSSPDNNMLLCVLAVARRRRCPWPGFKRPMVPSVVVNSGLAVARRS